MIGALLILAGVAVVIMAVIAYLRESARQRTSLHDARMERLRVERERYLAERRLHALTQHAMAQMLQAARGTGGREDDWYRP